MTYQTIYLDWDGTLSTSRFWGHWQSGEQAENYLRIQKIIFQDEPDLAAKWMTRLVTAEQVCQIVAPIINKPVEYVLAELRTSCEQMTFINPQLPKLIKDLQTQGITVMLATDNMDTFPRWTVPALDLVNIFDGILDSATLGRRKRDEGFFPETKQAILLDDNPKNVAVTEFGIDFQLVDGTKTAKLILEELTQN